MQVQVREGERKSQVSSGQAGREISMACHTVCDEYILAKGMRSRASDAKGSGLDALSTGSLSCVQPGVGVTPRTILQTTGLRAVDHS
jgi:hypothetical protein